jgi:hypothetical protein
VLFAEATLSIMSVILKRNCSAAYTDGWGCYKLPVPAVVGIAVGSVVFVFTVSVVIFLCCRYRKRKQERKNGEKERNIFYRGTLQPEPIPFNHDAY